MFIKLTPNSLLNNEIRKCDGLVFGLNRMSMVLMTLRILAIIVVQSARSIACEVLGFF